MRTAKAPCLLLAAALAMLVSLPAFAQDRSSTPAQEHTARTRAYRGEIMDSACAEMGSHKAMMAKEGATSPKECSDKCVQAGSKYVLYNQANKRTYQLDDQDKAKEFSGQKVRVTGTYDRATKTLHVENIEAAS